jgi:hypothetical protein
MFCMTTWAARSFSAAADAIGGIRGLRSRIQERGARKVGSARDSRFGPTPVSDVSERARETREKTGSGARSDNCEAYLARERSSVWRVVRPGAQRPREKRRSGFARKKGSRTVGVSEPQNLSLSRDRC